MSSQRPWRIEMLANTSGFPISYSACRLASKRENADVLIGMGT
jgi:hypothetical protein